MVHIYEDISLLKYRKFELYAYLSNSIDIMMQEKLITTMAVYG
jgi:hypothetical protein